jgi:hypothetical protein
MGRKAGDGNKSPLRSHSDLIPDDKTGLGEAIEHARNVRGVVRQHLGLDAFRAVLEAPVAVGKRPQPDEQQPMQRGQLGQLLVQKELRLDGPDACHHITASAKVWASPEK